MGMKIYDHRRHYTQTTKNTIVLCHCEPRQVGAWQSRWLHEIASAGFFSLATTEGKRLLRPNKSGLAMTNGVGESRVDPSLKSKNHRQIF